MSLILNVIWIVCGGFVMALGWFAAGVIAAITVIGLPWARACFTIGIYTLLPFGMEAVNRRELTGYEDVGTGPLGFIGNVLWFVFFGWWLAVGHVLAAIVCAITIIGLPFAWVHLKLAGASLFPIGLAIVDREVAAQARRRVYG